MVEWVGADPPLPECLKKPLVPTTSSSYGNSSRGGGTTHTSSFSAQHITQEARLILIAQDIGAGGLSVDRTTAATRAAVLDLASSSSKCAPCPPSPHADVGGALAAALSPPQRGRPRNPAPPLQTSRPSRPMMITCSNKPELASFPPAFMKACSPCGIVFSPPSILVGVFFF